MNKAIIGDLVVRTDRYSWQGRSPIGIIKKVVSYQMNGDIYYKEWTVMAAGHWRHATEEEKDAYYTLDIKNISEVIEKSIDNFSII